MDRHRYRSAGTGHLSVIGPVSVFAAAGLAAVLVIGSAVVWVTQRNATTAAVRDARDLTVADATAAITPVLSDGLLSGQPAAVEALDRAVRTGVLSERVVRVKVWATDGTILYSDAGGLIGGRFPLGDAEGRSLALQRANAEISNLAKPENRLERQYHKLLEVYDGVRTPSGQPLLFEAYIRFSSVSAAGHQMARAILPWLLAGLALLFLLQIPLACSLATSVARSRAEEQRLMRRALEAGENERRHVAADLHDGVVQSLVGTSLSLAAAAHQAQVLGQSALAGVIDRSAGELRQGVRDLRSLIVAIAPPRLHETGLAVALSDLASPLDARGIAAVVRVDDTLRIGPESEILLYRAAQEALRNAAWHARARNVSVSVIAIGGAGVDGRVRLEVADDGVGFTPELVAERQAGGHVGLRLLRELAQEAGGHLDIVAAPGEGTRLCLDIPAR